MIDQPMGVNNRLPLNSSVKGLVRFILSTANSAVGNAGNHANRARETQMFDLYWAIVVDGGQTVI